MEGSLNGLKLPPYTNAAVFIPLQDLSDDIRDDVKIALLALTTCHDQLPREILLQPVKLSADGKSRFRWTALL